MSSEEDGQLPFYEVIDLFIALSSVSASLFIES
jgi:hypothetical protein